MRSVRWGILSTAGIARVMVAATRQVEGATFVAVASRDLGRARAFAGDLGLAASFGSYEDLLASEQVDAVYVPLPVSMHTDWTLKALQAGKHVLCEKPFAMTAADATACFDAAKDAGRVCIEGLMWRLHPQTVLVRRLLAEGLIGDLATVRAALSVSVPKQDIRRRPDLGGGAAYDLGTYCVSALRLFAGRPERVYAEGVLDGPGGLDLRLAATLRFPRDVMGQFDIGLDLPRRDELELVGTKGRISIADPWICRSSCIEVTVGDVLERVPIDPDGALHLSHDGGDAYAAELSHASAVIRGEQSPEFGRADAVEQAHILETVLLSCRLGAAVQVSGVE